MRVVPGALDHLKAAEAGGQGIDDGRTLGVRVGPVGVERAHDDEDRAADVAELRADVGRGAAAHALHDLHPARFAQQGVDTAEPLGPVGRLDAGVGHVEVRAPERHAAERARAEQSQHALPEALDPQVAEADRLLAGERRRLDHRSDQRGLLRGGDGGGAAGDRVADEQGRAAQVADHGELVAGDGGAAPGRPADAGLAAAAQIDRGDPIAGRHQRRDHGTVRGAAVAHAVRENDQRAGPRHLVSDRAAVDGKILGHDIPQVWLTWLAKS